MSNSTTEKNHLSFELVIGTWELESFEQLGPDGLSIKSAPGSRGLLIYTPDETMAVAMYREPSTDDLDLLRNFQRHLYYAGTYRIEGEFVIHLPEIALHESHRNEPLPRRARLEATGKRLVLEALSPEGRILGTIVWKKRRK